MEDLKIKKLDYNKEDFKGKAPPVTKEQTKTILSQLENNVCKILKINENKGTGFLCKIPYPNQFKLFPCLITNNHALNEKDLEINKTIQISFDDDKIEKFLLIDESRKIFTNEELDVSIIEIKPELNGINNFLDVDGNIYENNDNLNYKNKSIYILQYPNGQKSSFKVDLIKEIDGKDIMHFCSTDKGSSGSPILLMSNFKVIGIHKGITKFSYNLGTFIKFVIEEFNKYNKKYNQNINIDLPRIDQTNNLILHNHEIYNLNAFEGRNQFINYYKNKGINFRNNNNNEYIYDTNNYLNTNDCNNKFKMEKNTKIELKQNNNNLNINKKKR